MLGEEEIKKLVEDLKAAKEKVAVLRNKLNSLNEEKELWFEKKIKVSKQISEKIGSVRTSKKARDSHTSEVRKLKEERNKYNKQVKEEIFQLKKLDSELNGMQVKLNIKSDPHFISKRIEALEYSVEHEPISFEKEQKIMKEINNLKRQMEECKGLTEVMVKIKSKSKEIDELKRKSNEIHRQIQEIAAQSQEQHEGLIGVSGELKELKEKEDEFQIKFLDKKKEFTEANDELKKQLDELQSIKRTLDQNKFEFEDSRKEEQKKILKAKDEKVKEKLKKKGAKLTTEDILVLQAQDR